MTGAFVPNRENLFVSRPVAMGVAFFLALFGVQALTDSAAAHWFSSPLEGVTLLDVIRNSIVAVVWTLVMRRWSRRGSA